MIYHAKSRSSGEEVDFSFREEADRDAFVAESPAERSPTTERPYSAWRARRYGDLWLKYDPRNGHQLGPRRPFHIIHLVLEEDIPWEAVARSFGVTVAELRGNVGTWLPNGTSEPTRREVADLQEALNAYFGGEAFSDVVRDFKIGRQRLRTAVDADPRSHMEDNLTPQERVIFGGVKNHPGLSAAQLAKILNIPESSVRNALCRLSTKRFVYLVRGVRRVSATRYYPSDL